MDKVLLDKAKNIKLLLLDVDGVLTDGSIVYDDKGVETKSFSVRDGHGITMLQRSGVECGIITARTSKVLLKRCDDLSIKLVYQGAKKKAEAFEDVLSKTGLNSSEIAYIGDDLVDLPVLRRVGLSATVSDGVEEVKDEVDFISSKQGGGGAVRELVELILKSNGRWKEVTSRYYEG
ncbi:MAG: HAD-IIIA family hydrolase [Deltaproteobacteria bacterium]|nr:HAD-IIIA family hydrolase [Deltaproteobacteria bacterium]